MAVRPLRRQTGPTVLGRVPVVRRPPPSSRQPCSERVADLGGGAGGGALGEVGGDGSLDAGGRILVAEMLEQQGDGEHGRGRVGLSLAGVDLSNIAIIAGALSVGIGFGLQNIVNNFVSGIILLFERPIRPGDWIVVGNTEGFVQKVRVRATEIQTFDRSDVIVPNSELISGQVTNWTYRDPYGRVICPVGVAYGSDVQLVRKLLLAVAEEHPQVISDGRTPPPKVFFLAFGDSALLFDLRCFISDVKSRLAVRSELNYAIDAAFRANGIQIPFPQQDLYVKSWPPESGSPGEVSKG